jgi:pilus assembly protein Flp/PilA
VEYGLILALITLASLAALTEMAGTTVGVWTTVAAKVAGAS